MKTRAFLLHALSPLHVGTGAAADIIDLPIARMKATGIPFVPGTSIKGVLRDLRRSVDPDKTEATFGPWERPEEHAGALVVGDARLLALPVRSFRGTFAWTTSPLLLGLAKRDLESNAPVPTISGRAAVLPQLTGGHACLHGGKLYLEDLDLSATTSTEATAWASGLAPLVSPADDIFSKRFAIVDDDTMSFLWDTATQVDARVRICDETGTVARGALWLEESLPAETLLVGILASDRSRRKGVSMSPDDVLDFALRGPEVLQLGGKASTGRGRCRMMPFDGSARA